MQSRILAVGLVLMLTAHLPLYAQYNTEDKTYKKCFVGGKCIRKSNNKINIMQDLL